MVKRRQAQLSIFDKAAVEAFCEEHGIKAVHTRKLWSQIGREGYLASLAVQQRATEHAETDLKSDILSATDVMNRLGQSVPQMMIDELPKALPITSTRIGFFQRSSDGTGKLLVDLCDKQQVETCIMRHTSSSNGKTRATICVSSQVGCQMGCTFCATGTMGHLGDLACCEIVEQVWHAMRVSSAPIRNIVFMGMGEPLNNYRAVSDSIDLLQVIFGIAPSHITVSTVGVVPRILSLAQDHPKVGLALSLHAATQDARVGIVPSAKAYKLDKLMAAVDEYQRQTDNKVFIEYILLAGINDKIEDQIALGEMLHGRKNIVLNFIPYNPTFAGSNQPVKYEAPTEESVVEFQMRMRNDYQVFATIRAEKGQEISGACGQLVVQKKATDIEDL